MGEAHCHATALRPSPAAASWTCSHMQRDMLESRRGKVQRGSKVSPEINGDQVVSISPELTYFSISQYKR